jgi:hypothetical protein
MIELTAVRSVKGALNTSGPLQLSNNAIITPDFLEEAGDILSVYVLAGCMDTTDTHTGPMFGADWARIPARLSISLG